MILTKNNEVYVFGYGNSVGFGNTKRYEPTLLKINEKVDILISGKKYYWISPKQKYLSFECDERIMTLLLVLKRKLHKIPKFVLFIIFGFAI
jgi:hypothetical protein